MSYSYFAKYYDRLTENVDYSAKADYLISMMQKHGHDFGVTLDLACGTGSLTIEMKKRGIDIFGADASADMLSEAQRKAYDENMQILFLRQKMQNLDLYAEMDTCICTLDSINHVTSRKQLLEVFSGVARFLSDNGLFVFDVNTIYKHRDILGDNCYIYDTDEVFCAWQNNYNAKNHKVIITLDFFEPDGDKYVRSSEQFSERAYSNDELESLLGSAGLEVVSIYEDMSFSPPTETSQKEIFIVRKKNQ